jgi:hypothetical protein
LKVKEKPFLHPNLKKPEDFSEELSTNYKAWKIKLQIDVPLKDWRHKSI